MPPERIQTLRLTLRKPSLDDAKLIFDRYAQDPEVTRFLLWRPHTSIVETNEFLVHCLKNWDGREDRTWVIEQKDVPGVFGMIGAHIDQHGANLGYVLARSEWNKGYATESVSALTDALLRSGQLHRVWAVCDVQNGASARVLEKAGMIREGVLRRWLVLPNIESEPRDCYCYSRTI